MEDGGGGRLLDHQTLPKKKTKNLYSLFNLCIFMSEFQTFLNVCIYNKLLSVFELFLKKLLCHKVLTNGRIQSN